MGRGAIAEEIDLASSRQSLIVRAAIKEDIPALTLLKREIAHKTYAASHAGAALDKWLAEHAGRGFFDYRIGRKDYYVFVATDEKGEIIGFGGYRQRGSRADGSSVGLYVRYPGKGIGKLLNVAREEHARSLGCKRARVACWRTNKKAQAFVISQGYKKTGSGYRDTTTGVMIDHFERDL
jgi:GNAT superfamily N-acetyltransferase